MTEMNIEKDCNPNAWWDDRTLAVKILMVVGFVILGAGLLFLFGLIVKSLWNWLMPEIFGLTTITYWQAWGLLVLSCILFGKIGSGSSGGSGTDRKRKRQLRSYIQENQSLEGENPEDTPMEE